MACSPFPNICEHGSISVLNTPLSTKCCFCNGLKNLFYVSRQKSELSQCDRMAELKVAKFPQKLTKMLPQQFLFLKWCFSKSPNSFPNIWETFFKKIVAKNFQKNPNLVTLNRALWVACDQEVYFGPILESSFLDLNVNRHFRCNDDIQIWKQFIFMNNISSEYLKILCWEPKQPKTGLPTRALI